MTLLNRININTLFFGAGHLSVYKDRLLVLGSMRPLADLRYSQESTTERFKQPPTMLRHLNCKFAGTKIGAVTESHQAAYNEKATTLIHSPLTKAFSISEEPTSLRQAYRQNKFEQVCLMARFLSKQGTRSIQVALDLFASLCCALGIDSSNTNQMFLHRLIYRVDEKNAVKEVFV
jgi:hypothetical protein